MRTASPVRAALAFGALLVVTIAGANGARADTCGPGGTHSKIVTPQDITFELERAYTCGQYVDGMFWVIDPGSGVRVTAMSPAYTGPRGESGYMINPSYKREIQPGVAGCDPVGDEPGCNRNSLSYRVASAAAPRTVWMEPQPLPLTLRVGQSLLKVEVDTSDTTCCNGTKTPQHNNNSVLTIVASNPTAGCPSGRAFRPPFAGTEKVALCSPTNAWIDANIPKLPDVPNQISIAQAQAYFGNRSAWTLNKSGNAEGSNFTINATKIGSTYGASLALNQYVMMNRVLQSGTAEQKRPLVEMLTQMGIDRWGMARAGVSFHSDGGINAGNKAPILFAWRVTGYTAFRTPPGSWHEDMMTWKKGASLPAVFGDLPETVACSSGQNSTGRFADGLRDGGCSDYGPLDSDKTELQKTVAEMRLLGKYSYANYQRYTHAQGVAALAPIRYLGIEGAWNHPPFFEYNDRILTSPWNGACSGYCDDYLAAMARAYSKGSTGSPPPPPAASPPDPPVLLP